MDAGLRYVSDTFRSYFAWLSECSARNRPPGPNAANGYFHEAVVQGNPGLPDEPAVPLVGEEQQLFDCYLSFRNDLHGCFVNAPNHHANALFYMPIVIEGLRRFMGDVVGIVAAILTYANVDEAGRAVAQNRLAEAGRRLADDVTHSGFQFNGTHANGYISAFTQDAANRALVMIQPIAVRGPVDDAARIARVFQATCERLAGLSRDGHAPWLRADWQVAFETITATAAEAFAT